jgi:hypothetical protein
MYRFKVTNYRRFGTLALNDKQCAIGEIEGINQRSEATSKRKLVQALIVSSTE